MSPASARRLLLFGSLYFAQGAILSYFLTFNVLYLRAQGLDAADIGLFQAVLVLPFVLKILLGMVSDRYSLFGLGHRLPYIVVGLVVQLAAVAWMPLIALPQGLVVFFAVALAAAVGMALYDTCTDGLAVETTPADERGRVQAVMVGARAAGILAALLFGGLLVARAGWDWVFLLVFVMTLPALGLVLLFARRSPVTADTAGFRWSAFGALLRREVLVLAAIGCVYALALDGVLGYLSYHPNAEVGDLVGLVSGLVALSMFGRILGAAASGWVSARLGYRRGLGWAVLGSALACLALSIEAGTGLLAAACLLFGIAYGFFTAAYAATAMRFSDPRIAASMFAVFMLFLNVGVALGQALGGFLTEAFGFQTLAWSMAALAAAAALLVRRLPSPR